MGLRGTNQELARHYNRRIVLEFIRAHGPIARGDIAEGVGLTVQTVSTIVRELEEMNYLLTLRKKPNGRGAPAHNLQLNPEGGYAIGIDVSPLGVGACLMNLAGEIIATESRDVHNVQPDEGFILIEELIDTMRAHRPDGRLLAIGMGMPGPFDVEGMSFVGPTTLTGWQGISVSDRLTRLSGLPSFVEVDMAAAAMAAFLYGDGRGLDDFYFLHLGAGIGGTMVHAGRPVRGAFGNAGEIGHLPFVPDGLQCPCGNRGCLELYISLEAFARRPEGQSETEWAQEIQPIFYRAIQTIENLFDPQTIILGGIAQPSLLNALVDTTKNLPVTISARKGRILPRVIAAPDRYSVLRGAASIALAGVLSPDPETPLPGDPFSDGLSE